MTPNVFQRSHKLQIRDDVLIFQLRVDSLNEKNSEQPLTAELLASVQAEMNSIKPSVVVIDLQNIDSISTTALNNLIELTQSEESDQWMLILYGLTAELQDSITQSANEHSVTFAHNENDLRRLVEETPHRAHQRGGEPEPSFTEDEIDQMLADNVTFDDAIQAVERLRG